MTYRSLAFSALAALFLFSCGDDKPGENGNPDDSLKVDTSAVHDTTSGSDTTSATIGKGDHARPKGPMGEEVGAIYVGMPEEGVVKEMGEAKEKTPLKKSQVDGMEHQEWKYPSKGLVVGMVKDGEEMVVDQITLSGKSPLKTARKVGIGSTREEVKTAYLDDIDPESDPLDDEHIVIGSAYEGILFTMEDQVVTKVFVGASAE